MPAPSGRTSPAPPPVRARPAGRQRADVGIVGYTLGGGLGWLARAHGFACNSVTAIELVTADGEPVRTDRAPSRSSSGRCAAAAPRFGIVTAMEFELYPVDELHGGALALPRRPRREIFAAWRDWTQTVPDEVTTLCRLVSPPGGAAIVLVEAAILGDDASSPRCAR